MEICHDPELLTVFKNHDVYGKVAMGPAGPTLPVGPVGPVAPAGPAGPVGPGTVDM